MCFISDFIFKKIGLDEENSMFFTLWICSKHLSINILTNSNLKLNLKLKFCGIELQLKNDHKPLQRKMIIIIINTIIKHK